MNLKDSMLLPDFNVLFLHDVRQRGLVAVDELASVILNKIIDLVTAAQVLEEIGAMEELEFCAERRHLLERCLLETTSHYVRDGAMRGISYMDDPQSLGAIVRALQHESHPRLKRYMEHVAVRLMQREAQSLRVMTSKTLVDHLRKMVVSSQTIPRYECGEFRLPSELNRVLEGASGVWGYNIVWREETDKLVFKYPEGLVFITCDFLLGKDWRNKYADV